MALTRMVLDRVHARAAHDQNYTCCNGGRGSSLAFSQAGRNRPARQFPRAHAIVLGARAVVHPQNA